MSLIYKIDEDSESVVKKSYLAMIWSLKAKKYSKISMFLKNKKNNKSEHIKAKVFYKKCRGECNDHFQM